MKREYIAAAAQLGPIEKDEPRSSAVSRMVALLHEAKARGGELVVFPELALTTFSRDVILRMKLNWMPGLKLRCQMLMCSLYLTPPQNLMLDFTSAMPN